MSWLALLLIGVGVGDIVRTIRPVPAMPEAVGAGSAILVGLVAGLTDVPDVAALVAIAAVVIAWGVLSRRQESGWSAALPLVLLGVAVVAALLFSPLASEAGGGVDDWLDATPWPLLADLDTDRALLVAGALLIQCATGNVIVRMVLRCAGTSNPLTPTLKGGRLLGPMERLVILGLGLSGQVAAASAVIAAKGLIRWPELRSIESTPDQPSINEVTEYVLVGSFVSWLVALSSLVLLA